MEALAEWLDFLTQFEYDLAGIDCGKTVENFTPDLPILQQLSGDPQAICGLRIQYLWALQDLNLRPADYESAALTN